jgi:hypothetical protein
VHVEPLLDQVRDDVLNLFFGGPLFHYDNHGEYPCDSEFRLQISEFRFPSCLAQLVPGADSRR